MVMTHLCSSVDVFGFGLCQDENPRGHSSWSPRGFGAKNLSGSNAWKKAWLCQYYNRTHPDQKTAKYTLPSNLKVHSHFFEAEHVLLDRLHNCGVIHKFM